MRYIEHKIEKDGFNSFTAANDDNFGAQMTERQSRFLVDKQNFWGHLFSYCGEFSSKGVVNFFGIWNHSVKSY